MHHAAIKLPALAALAFLLVAQASPNESAPNLPAQSTELKGVVVPVPKEIFDTLDKFANSNWRAVQRADLTQQASQPDQVKAALSLGAVIAEGFVAIEAQDANEVDQVGRAVLKSARALGVEKVAIRRSRSIVEHAQRGDWPGVRKEWDGVLPDVEQGMNELKSEQLAQLVSLGGWLRGAEALTALILQNYSSQQAELLRQPALLDHFEKQLAAMNDDRRNDPIVIRMRQALQKIRPIVTSQGASVSAAQVGEISAVSKALLETLGHGLHNQPAPQSKAEAH